MNVIYINRELSKEEINNILNFSDVKIYSNIPLPKELTKFEINKINISTEERKKINYLTFEKVLNFGEIQINKKHITDVLYFEKANLWHYNKFRVYFLYRNLYFEKEVINILSRKYDKITAFVSNELLKDFTYENNVSFIFLVKKKKKNIKWKKILFFVNYIIFFLTRVLITFPRLFTIKNKKYIIIEHTLEQAILDINTFKVKKGNQHLEYLLKEIDEDFLIIQETPFIKSGNNIKFNLFKKNYILKKNYIFSEIIIFLALFNYKYLKKTFNQYIQINNNLKLWLNVLSNDDKIILKTFMSIYKSNLLYLYRYVAYKLFLSKYKIKTISSIDENSPLIKTILDAAKQNEITTFGIQHGAIHELHPAYMYTRNDKYRKVVPDYTLMWGEYWSNLLINKGNYPKESLMITGQIRTDIIPLLKNKKLPLLNIDTKNRAVITFASQPQRDSTLRYQIAKDVFKAVKKLENDLFLVLKLHPAEYNDKNYYVDIANEVKCTNYKIVSSVDLYTLIYQTNALITSFSTVGVETIYFYKPLVIYDPLSQDIQNYNKEKVAFSVKNYSDLLSVLIDLIITKKLKINKKAYENYIHKYAYKIDGKVRFRILKAITNKNK